MVDVLFDGKPTGPSEDRLVKVVHPQHVEAELSVVRPSREEGLVSPLILDLFVLVSDMTLPNNR